MPDWETFVRHHLRLEGMSRRSEERIVQELADQLEDDYLAHLARGLSEEEAQHRVHDEVTDWERLTHDILAAQPQYREPALLRWLDPDDPPCATRMSWGSIVADLRRDTSFAVRSLRRVPGFVTAAVLILAFGIGANTAIFSVLNALILKPLPYPDSDRLMVVWERQGLDSGRAHLPLSGAGYLDWKERSTSFAELGGQTFWWASLAGGSHPERVRASRCTASFLRLLGVEPAMGRIFSDQEEADGEPYVVLSHGLWQRRYAATADILGRQIEIAGTAHTVLGVMPKGFSSPRPWPAESDAEMWLPVDLDLQGRPRRHHWLFTLGRLKEGVSVTSAEEELRTIAAKLAEEYPQSNSQIGAWMEPLIDRMVGSVRQPVWYLLVAVATLLLIACANVASMLLARSTVRQGEMAVRASLGAGKWRLVRQLLTESVVLSLLGGLAGVLFASWGVAVLRGMIPASVERSPEIAIDGRVLLFSLVVTVVTGLFFGLAPVQSAMKLDLASVLREGQRSVTAGRLRLSLQSVLVVVQFALALVLSHGAVLMLGSYLKVINTRVVFSTERTLVAEISLQGPRYEEPEAQAAFWDRLQARLEAAPGVTAVGITSKLPLAGGANGSVLVGSETYDPEAERPLVEFSAASAEYFGAMAIPLLAGRLFTNADNGNQHFGMIVNRAFAELYWPGSSALGKTITQDSAEPTWTATVVGVVEDVPQWGIEEPTLPEVYYPFAISQQNSGFLVISAGVPPLTLVPEIRREVAAIDPGVPVSQLRTMADVLHKDSARRRFHTLLIELFTVLALIMVAVGVYGVTSYYVAQQAPEIAIRITLGADRWSVIRMVAARGLGLAALGVTLGCAASLLLARALESLVFGVRPSDPATLLVVGLGTALVSLLGSASPALRATQIDPARALHPELPGT